MIHERPDLFSPVRLGNLELKNRMVRSATAERLATEPIGRATPALAALYRELARGGVGLIVTGHAFVAAEGKAHPEMLSAHCDEMILGLSTLADAVHAESSCIALQINHGGRHCDGACTPTVVAPSAVATLSGRMPREMTAAEIVAAVDAFGQAARRGKLAGFDAVQLHAAHGYLIGQFLSPHTNRRTDGWGGGLDQRLRFLTAVCEAARGHVGADYPLFVKLGMMDNLERVPDGLAPEEGARIVSRLADLGLDAVEISGGYGGGQGDFNGRLAVGSKAPEAYFRPLARRAKATTRLPVILVGGLRSRVVMDDVLASGDADLISLCRPLIREPDLPDRLQSGLAAAACISGGRCWPRGMGQGIACKCES
jgi:2,4-dienoyl-CoA reductase-like NADH-dependent reductase (Old Yellow Enzyme family)